MPDEECAMETKNIDEFHIKDYDLIIFDCDGTLVDSEPLSNATVGEMMREVGLDISNEVVLEQFRGTSFVKITEFIEKTIGKPLDFDFEAQFRERSEKVFRAELKTIPGASNFISKLDVDICVASNGPTKKMLITLEVTDLLPYFSKGNMFSAYDIQKWKPEPDLYLHAAKIMGKTAEKCLVIEDTMPGAMGARNAGMDVLVYAKGTDQKIFKKEGIPIFSSFEQLEMCLL